MSESVADTLWSMLAGAGVQRCYGIVGDALNPVIDALRRDGRVEFIQMRNEEAGVFAAVAEASLTGNLVAVCGTAGPGAMHLINGLIDAQREGVPVIAIVGDTLTGLIDSGTIEEINPYVTFQIASLYTGRLVSPAQTRTVVQTAIRTALSEHGPTVIAVPGDVAVKKVPDDSYQAVLHNPPLVRPSDADLRALSKMLDEVGSVTIFGGDGCRDAHDEVVALATKLQAPVGYAYRGKQWLEWGNPNAVGMTGLLGWGGAYEAMQHCDLCLLLGTNFPLPDFYPKKAKKVQVDLRATNIGRRAHIDMGLVGDIKDTITALLPLVAQKRDTHHLHRALKTTEKWRTNMSHYVRRGPDVTPIRPEYLVSVIDELADDDAVVCADTGTAVIWTARYITAKQNRNILGSFSWAAMANAMPNSIGAALACSGRQAIGICGDGGLSMLMGDLLTIAERQIPVKLVVLDNSGFQFVHIEQEEAGIQPFGTKFVNPDLAKVAESIGLTGIRVEDPGQVRRAVAEFLATPGPAILDAVVEPDALSLPSHVSFGEAEGFSLSLAKQAVGGNLDDVIETVGRNVHLI
jgi:pyruvate dehydrogenase (quinone)